VSYEYRDVARKMLRGKGAKRGPGEQAFSNKQQVSNWRDIVKRQTTVDMQSHTCDEGDEQCDPHTRVHRVFKDTEYPHRCWPRDWTRDQCVIICCWRPICTILGRQDAVTCPQCNAPILERIGVVTVVSPRPPNRE